MRERQRRRQREEEERMREIERRRRIARKRKRRQQVRRRRKILAMTVFFLVFVIVVLSTVAVRKLSEEKKRQEMLKKQEQQKAEEEQNLLNVVAVGDNLIHDAIIDAGKENNWDFSFLYKNLKEEIKEADIASVNQETPFVKNHEKAAGYPDFATPTEVGDALAAVGFDIVTQATEHAFDQEAEGIAGTASFWKKNYPEMSILGIHGKEGENRYRIIEKKNFKIAVLNYTTLLSENHTIKDEEAYMLDIYSEKNMKKDIAEAKEASDVTIVYLHGGKTDSEKADKKLQKRIKFLAEQGADVVICSHPHILKGYGKVERPDGKEMLVYYSLGNFVSNQPALEKLLGGMAKFTLKKNEKSGEVTVKDYSLIPLVMHYNSDYTECSVYKLSDYTESMAQEHGIHDAEPDTDFTAAELKSAAADIGEIEMEFGKSEDEDADKKGKKEKSAKDNQEDEYKNEEESQEENSEENNDEADESDEEKTP